MLWDTGLAMHLSKAWVDGGARPPKRSIVDQLASIGVKPSQIGLIGLSHWHPDHIGQAAMFPSATLMIGKEDWDILKAYSAQLDPETASPWLSGAAPLDLVDGDRDIFGDGSVVMLKTPGHTPGHHSLLIRLRTKGAVILTGDAINMRESYDRDLVEAKDFDRAQALASLARLKEIAHKLKATVVISHEPDDVEKLPLFPNPAE